MNASLLLCAAAAFLGGVLATQQPGDQIVILSGDTQGYLSPCGCSSPMMGGIRRRATAIRSLSEPGRTIILENGGLGSSPGRQDQMKAETIAQSMAALGVTAINIGPSDAGLGLGTLLQIGQLSGDLLVTMSVAHSKAHGLGTTVRSGLFLIGGATNQPLALATSLGDVPVPIRSAVKTLVDAAAAAGVRPILMLQAGHDEAVRLAREFPQLALIQYSSVGDPPAGLEEIGSTALATTGEHGKHIVRLAYRAGRFGGYRSVALGPEFRDDPVVSRYYSAYLRRVKSEKLLDKFPRRETPPYAGSWACTSCHQASSHVWKGSQHRRALTTLTQTQHEGDPDCVSCHVTGLESSRGFRSMATTPQLTGVGCESCHGPSFAHARHPKTTRLPRLTEKACTGCHNTLNSPNFEFETYWKKIVHSEGRSVRGKE